MKPLAILLAGLVLLAGTPAMPVAVRPWSTPIVAPAVATSAVYVYEKDATAVPAGVTAGIDRLNRERKIVATLLEADTVDGTDRVPEQYRVAMAAAKHAELPALVVLSGTAVMKVVKAPTTEDEVVRAVP